MLRVLTPEQELASRKKRYALLEPESLFDLGGKKFFIAAERVGDFLTVIELDGDNIKRILSAESCVRSILNFEEMSCLNVHNEKK